MRKYLILLFLLFPCLSYAAMPVNPSYVSPDGSGSTCTSGSPCALSYANTNAAAGDTVYLKGTAGNYIYNYYIQPANSGTSGSRITFAADPAATVTPTLINTGTKWGGYYYGIILYGVRYVTVSGITVGPDTSSTMQRLFYIQSSGASASNASSYNIISNCKFYGNNNGEYTRIWSGGASNVGATNNVISGCTIANTALLYWSGSAVGEYVGLQIGDSAADNLSINNTVINSTLYCNGHHDIETFTKYNALVNNFMHNEGCAPNNTGHATVYAADSNGLWGHRNIQIYDGYNDSGKFNLVEGNRFGPSGAAPENDGGDGFTLTAPKNILRFNSIYNSQNNGLLMKLGLLSRSNNNRIYNNTIYASGRYNNGGTWLGYDFRWYVSNGTATISNIIGSSGTVTVTTSATHVLIAGDTVTISSTTNYNGSYVVTERTDDTNFKFAKAGDIAQETSGSIAYALIGLGNVVKNNILYGGAGGNYYYGGQQTAVEANNTISNNHLTASGDPKFIDTTLPAITGTQITTQPNLKLQSGSGAIKAGSSLTLANGAGTSSTSLTVDDALYFQAGSASATTPIGSSLSSIAGDYILINGQVRQITDINYTTNVLTLDSAATWADDAPIYLYKKSDGVQVSYGGVMDIGAEPFTGNASVGTGAGFSLGVGASISVQ